MKKATTVPRKKPVQKRSAQMVDDILRGAIRVLKQQGGRKFTTIRVAEEAGISVGSLYQYFPNKESILFQIQDREWQETSGILLGLIGDRRHAPARRLSRMAHAFFESEWEEASLRKALAETGVMMDDCDEFREIRSAILLKMAEFIGEISPKMEAGRRRFAAEFVFTTMGALAEEVTNGTRSKADVQRWAGEFVEMVRAYLRARDEGDVGK